MAVALGAGWELVHLTDRVIELRKDDPAYRRMVGRDGYVRLRAEPGMDRNTLLNTAVELAKQNDARLSEFAARDILPSSVRRYQMRQRTLATTFGIPGEEPEARVYRP